MRAGLLVCAVAVCVANTVGAQGNDWPVPYTGPTVSDVEDAPTFDKPFVSAVLVGATGLLVHALVPADGATRLSGGFSLVAGALGVVGGVYVGANDGVLPGLFVASIGALSVYGGSTRLAQIRERQVSIQPLIGFGERNSLGVEVSLRF